MPLHHSQELAEILTKVICGICCKYLFDWIEDETAERVVVCKGEWSQYFATTMCHFCKDAAEVKEVVSNMLAGELAEYASIYESLGTVPNSPYNGIIELQSL